MMRYGWLLWMMMVLGPHMAAAGARPAAAQHGRASVDAAARAHTDAAARPPQRPDSLDDIPDLFAPKSWQPPAPPPAPVVQAPPPAQVAPPLPFKFAGMVETSPGHVVYYLVQGDQSFAVMPGETFASVYQLEAVEHGRLVLVYTPLHEKQFISIGTDQ
jgi:hypothetical protein